MLFLILFSLFLFLLLFAIYKLDLELVDILNENESLQNDILSLNLQITIVLKKINDCKILALRTAAAVGASEKSNLIPEEYLVLVKALIIAGALCFLYFKFRGGSGVPDSSSGSDSGSDSGSVLSNIAGEVPLVEAPVRTRFFAPSFYGQEPSSRYAGRTFTELFLDPNRTPRSFLRTGLIGPENTMPMPSPSVFPIPLVNFVVDNSNPNRYRIGTGDIGSYTDDLKDLDVFGRSLKNIFGEFWYLFLANHLMSVLDIFGLGW